jgi:hypothetical protein
MTAVGTVGRKAAALLLATAVAGALILAYQSRDAGAAGGPADKVAVRGSETEFIGPGENISILSERMKVSSPSDLMLAVSLECSILTELVTSDEGGGSASAQGQVKIWVEVDGKHVPISPDDEDQGRVVFCDRAYERTVTDNEDPADGTDTEEDFIDTRTANGFNWLAINTGTVYDDLANGQNILDIVVRATLTTEATNGTAEAIIGNRTLIVEPTHLAVSETTNGGNE